MSNKNLKVYKILFLTQVKTLHLNVKFPCEIKMTWKRSNESAQTQKVKLLDGQAVFNETLKLHVNMYFDMKTNKFVEKKCIYSFLIFTDKGEKSAGSVTYDLADFFNKRVYEVQQSFPLQKCPVKDTKVDMKIYYEQSVQSGYDSMSQISMTSQLDESASNPLDLSEIESESKEDHSQKSNSTVEPSKSLEPAAQERVSAKDEKYGNLNQSDVDSEEYKSRKIITEKRLEYRLEGGNENKIGQNIKGIEEVTHKLNDFAVKFRQNLSYDVQEKKRKISQLTEDLESARQLNRKLELQLNEQKSMRKELQAGMLTMKSSLSSNQGESARKIQDLQRKLEQERRNTQKLQKRMLDASEKGQEEGKYVQELKDEFKKEQTYLKAQIQRLNKQLKNQKCSKLEADTRAKQAEDNYQDLSQKYDRLLAKHEDLESGIRKREQQIEEARINLDKAVQDLIQSLSAVL